MAATYGERISQQINQFANVGALWKLPPIYGYWNQKYIVPRLKQVSGTSSIFDAYFDALVSRAMAKKGDRAVLYSIGAGDCTIETHLAERLKKQAITNARIVCLELSPMRLDRARKAASAKGVAELMEFVEADLNVWQAPEPVDVFIAHHTLHHLVELETIYDAIKAAMTDDSVFLTTDMIGRNGHQRWPEALHWINHIWAVMPDRYKLNFQFNTVHEQYLDWDCSGVGFEGIRAQAVLPLLLERFGYDWFLGYGGTVDPFIDRGYGQNFDVNDPADTAFIDFIEDLNQSLLEADQITPTMMMACFRKGVGKSKSYANVTPERSCRQAELAPVLGAAGSTSERSDISEPPGQGHKTLECASMATNANDCFEFEGENFVIDMTAGPRRPSDDTAFKIVKSREYLSLYDEIANGLHPSGLLELGVFQGGSFVYLDKLLKPRRMSAVEISDKPIKPLADYVRRTPGRFVHYGVSQSDADTLRAIVVDELEGELDVVIDDASHAYEHTKVSFEVLFPLLRPGGLYIIEDWGWGHAPAYQAEGAPFYYRPALTTLLFEQIAVMGSTDRISDIWIKKPLYVITKALQSEEIVDDVWQGTLMRGRKLHPI